MKAQLLRVCLLGAVVMTLPACGPGGSVTVPGITQNSLDMPDGTIEKWNTLSEKGDKGTLTTVKTGNNVFKFDGSFPSSILGNNINVPVAGTITYNSDGKAIIRYSLPLHVRVNAVYTVSNLGASINLTAIDSEPALVKAGEKTTLNRTSITKP